MKKTVIILSAFILMIIACAKVPVTGRKQVHLLPESELVSMSLTSYREEISKHPNKNSTPEGQMVIRVGNKMAAAVAAYLKSKNQSKRIEGFEWEFNLVQSNEINAWCMPGGKVCVYTGILPYTQTETGLAVVMGHEIAHAVARHGNERMSQGMLAQMGGIALSVALSDKPRETQNLFLSAYGAGAQLGLILPYSRIHESEADKMGLIFMAMAGYNPQEAVAFWKRMSAAGGTKPPTLLSTHPNDEKRAKDLEAFMPQALKYYKPTP